MSAGEAKESAASLIVTVRTSPEEPLTAPIDIAKLPAPAQKILDPASPLPLRTMGARGIVPGLRPGDILAVVVALSQGTDGVAEQARATLEAIPAPVLNGALAGDLQPAVLDVLGLRYARDDAVAERVLMHRAVATETVITMASIASEPVCELIATNEERLLAVPSIIEKLYLNSECRMSTADRILELAVRNGIELAIPAYAQAKLAISGELVAAATEEPSFDDTQFTEARVEAEALVLTEEEDTHTVDEETGEEHVIDKAKPLHAVWANLRAPAKIRLLNLANIKTYSKDGRIIDEQRFDQKALRMMGVRDANPLVAVAALNTPGIQDSEVMRISGMRNVAEDVMREIGNNREWTRHYIVKYNLVANPRTPFGHASKWILHMRDNDLKTLAKSKDVPQAVRTAAKQQLLRKGKK